MINRANWKQVKKYLAYRYEVDQLSPESARLEEVRLRHLLEWADETPFEKVARIRPTFPEYVLTARLDDSNIEMSAEYAKKNVRAAKRFFKWLSKHQKGFRGLSNEWIETLRPRRQATAPRQAKGVTLDEVQAMARASVEETWERRIKAAASLLFLSGMRVGAFVSLPLEAIDLDQRTIKQWPSLGVRTKFKKHATTYLLDIPELLDVARDWDREVRHLLPLNGLWFAPISTETGMIDPNATEVGRHRAKVARKDLRRWTEELGIPYRTPHQFRHGHAVYALKLAQNVADLKAVSQNLMHANLSITDGVYGILSGTDVQERIGALGEEKGGVLGTLSKGELSGLNPISWTRR
jgi:integrase